MGAGRWGDKAVVETFTGLAAGPSGSQAVARPDTLAAAGEGSQEADVLADRQTDRQTDRHTDRQMPIANRPLTAAHSPPTPKKNTF